MSYPSLTIGARKRLTYFQNKAEELSKFRPVTWRDARFANTLKHSDTDLDGGFNNEGAKRVPVWYSHSGPQFRNERDANDIVSLSHDGWYTDADECGGNELAFGIVAGLPHGRFLAGYRLTTNDERVYFGELFDNERDAAYAADEHARIIAESESEYHQKWNAARDLDMLIEEKKEDVLDCKQRLEIAIAACEGAKHNSVTWMRAMLARKTARGDARMIIEDIRGFAREREAMGDI